MNTDLSCVSKRLGGMIHAYLRIGRVAMLALSVWLGAALEGRAEPGLLCVLVPHFKDEYWISVAYGIQQQATARGLHVHFFEAGGYRAVSRQIEQLTACTALTPDAILIGAVSSDAPALLEAVRGAADKQPVIGLVNALASPALAARVGVDWADMGRSLGLHLAQRFPGSGAAQQAILLSGPTESGWVAPLENGLRQGLAGSSIKIVATYSADTGVTEQLRLLEHALAEQPRPTVIIGDAPAIESAMALLPHDATRPVLVATYISHSVARGLVGGQVAAAPFDDPIEQGKLAVDVIGKAVPARLSGPPIRIIAAGAAPESIRLSPADYFPLPD